jgi:chorismate-pyruvate lyase
MFVAAAMTDTPAVDLLNELARAQFAKPATLGAVNLRALSPLQRALLVIDGTVTKFLEAYTLEPVEVSRIAESEVVLESPDPWLEAPAGMSIAVRQVRITGRYSRVLYVYALSLVVLPRLPDGVRRRLAVEGEGIGRALSDEGVEHRRDLLWFGREHASGLPPELGLGATGEFNTRTYRIIASGAPIALINEKFPVSLDSLPARD